MLLPWLFSIEDGGEVIPPPPPEPPPAAIVVATGASREFAVEQGDLRMDWSVVAADLVIVGQE